MVDPIFKNGNNNANWTKEFPVLDFSLPTKVMSLTNTVLSATSANTANTIMKRNATGDVYFNHAILSGNLSMSSDNTTTLSGSWTGPFTVSSTVTIYRRNHNITICIKGIDPVIATTTTGELVFNTALPSWAFPKDFRYSGSDLYKLIFPFSIFLSSSPVTASFCIDISNQLVIILNGSSVWNTSGADNFWYPTSFDFIPHDIPA
jgi:hypothetical protein